MSLRLQYLTPVGIVLAAGIFGWFLDSLAWATAVGAFIAICVALLLSRYATLRLDELASIPIRSSEDSTPLLEATGTFDEIDAAYSVLARWRASERAIIGRERSQTERQIRLLDRLADGVMLAASDGSVIYANVSAASLLGGRNPVGGSFIAAVRDHEASEALFECLQQGTEARRNIEIPGEDRVVEAILARVSFNPPEAVVVMRDVTELARLQTLRRDFVANVSHELRTPLSTVKILTETIIDLDASQPDQLRFLQKIDAEVDSMSALVEDLLQLTQLESSRNPIRRAMVDASELVREVEERMRPIAERHHVVLTSRVEDAVIPLYADERRVKQALINLVSNAIVHTPPGGSVEIIAETCRPDLKFTVKDSGVGIPAADLDRIWERFYKVDRSRTHPGTGLGLAIVKHVVQAHNGSVDVRSQLGHGSAFEMRLPL
jgi:two-component system, OmpR family, phosphate regulon sensor histidine kinase PhoR